MKLGLQKKLYLGNLNSKRDWGHAADYVEAMWLILQQDVPDDYVIATGEAHSVKEFVERAFAEVGIAIEWKGSGVDEKGIVSSITTMQGSALSVTIGDVVVEVDPRYFRPTEVDILLGDPSKAEEKLGWKPKIAFSELVREMVSADIEEAEKDMLCRKEGFQVIQLQ